jgi:hypothetical protein
MANDIRLNIPIIPGIRQDINRFAGAEPGTLRDAQNVRFEKTGEARRRNGYASTLAISTAGIPALLAKCGDKAIWNNNGFVYLGPYSTADRTGVYPTLRPLGSLGTLTADSTSDPLAGMPALAISSTGASLLAFTNDYGVGAKYVHFQVRAADGSMLDAGSFSAGTTVLIANGVAPRAIALADGTFILVYHNETSGTYEIVKFSGATQTTTSLTLDGPFDIFSVGSTDAWVLAYYNLATSQVVVRYMNSLTTTSTTTAAPTATPQGISVHVNASRVFVGYSSSAASRMRIYTRSGSTITFSSDNSLWTTDAESRPPPVASEYQGTATIVRVVGAKMDQDTSGAATGQTQRMMSGVLNGTSFSQDHHCPWNCVPVSRAFGPEGCYVVIDRRSTYVESSNPTRKYCRGVIRRFNDRPGDLHVWELSLGEHTDGERTQEWLVSVPTDLDGAYVFFNKFAIPRGSKSDPIYEVIRFGLDSALPELGRSTSQTYQGVTVGGNPCDFSDLRAVSNTRPSTVYTGIDWSFPAPPGIMYKVSSNGSGSLTNSGTYQYLAIFRYIDALGRVHRSRLSHKQSITLGASDDTVAIYITKEDITRKVLSRDVTLELYRTENNGAAFYLTKSVPGWCSNAANSGGVEITDTTSDAALVSNELLYTHSIAESHFAPAARYVVHTKSRTWLGGMFRGNTIQASLKHVAGEAPHFNNEIQNFRVQLPKDCTGLAAVSDVLVGFTIDSIHAVYGEGPNDRGEGEFSEPQTISTAIGCINSRSILSAEDTVLFQSARGIEILDRGLGAPSYIGEAVRDELEARPFVFSSWYNSDDRTAHFLVGASYSNTPTAVRVLVFDFQTKAWSVDTAIDGTVAAGTYVPGIGNILWQIGNGSTGGTLYTESTTETNDGATAFTSSLTLHDIYPFGRDGSGSVRVFDMMIEPATGDILSQSMGLDRKATRTVPWTFASPAGGEEACEMTPSNSSKCTSVQLVVSSAPSSATGKTKFLGFTLWVVPPGEAPQRRLYAISERQ